MTLGKSGMNSLLLVDENSDISMGGWGDEYREGNISAAEQLWNHYFAELARIGDRHLFDIPIFTGEDAASAAMYEVLRIQEDGKSILDQVKDRGDLTPILVKKTQSRAIDLLREYYAKKRHPGELVSLDQIGQVALDSARQEASPELAAMIREEVELWLKALGSERVVVEYLLDGFNLLQIANRVGLTPQQVDCLLSQAVSKLFRMRRPD